MPRAFSRSTLGLMGCLCLLLASLGSLSGTANAAALEITEFPVPTKISRPHGITAGPDENVWFTEEWPETRKIGRITPEGQITEFPLTWGAAAPNSIAAGSDGNLWFTDGLGVGRVSSSGQITQFPLPGGGGRQTFGIAAGSDGNLWFSEVYPHAIGRVTPKGQFAEFQLPEGSSRPRRVTAGPDGSMWFTLSEPSAIGKITLEGQITLFPLPDAGSTPIGITGGPDKSLWFTERWGNKIGRIDILGNVTEFPLPGNEGMPEEITLGPDGNLWFTLAGSGRLGRITPSGEVTEYAIPTENSVPRDIVTGPDGRIWFAENLGEKIGRFDPPAAAPVPSLPENTKPPAISGTLEQGRTLTASSGSWTNSPTNFAYQWEDCEDKGGSCTPISKATTAKYTLTATDVGHTIRVRVIASNADGAGDPAVSGATAVVSANLTSAPTIDAESVSKVTANNAILEADINPHGLQTVYKLQIDTTGNFKFDQNDSCALHPPGIFCAQVIIQGDPLPSGLVEPPESSLPASFESQHVSVNLGSIGAVLQPNTTYHYRAIAANSRGFAYGADKTFTTPSNEVGPPIIESKSVTGITANNATLNAKINPHGLDTKYGFYLAYPICPPPEPGTVTCLAIGTIEVPVTGGVISASSGPMSVSVNLVEAGIALSPGTKYEWWVEATNSMGNTSKSGAFSTPSIIIDTFDFSLAVTKFGTGSGMVTSSPVGINCGATCTAKFEEGTKVTLTAEADEGSDFTGWSGSGCSGTSTCIVSMFEAKKVAATFDSVAKEFPLSVNKTGAGSGKIISSPSGIDCGLTCSAEFEEGTKVKLIPEPDSDSEFREWSGACLGANSCEVTMSEARSVGVRFSHQRPRLTLEKSGAGTVKSRPRGITCLSDCASVEAFLPKGTTVVLTAKAAPEGSLENWIGCDSSTNTGTEGTCTVEVGKSEGVGAIFKPAAKPIANPQWLVVRKAGFGSGTVRAKGLVCEAACGSTAVEYFGGQTSPPASTAKPPTLVTLTETPTADSSFGAWSGCDEVDVEGRCLVSMGKVHSVTAQFMPKPRFALVFGKSWGAGAVKSKPKGIACLGACISATASLPEGTTVVLTAKAPIGGALEGWGGCDSSTNIGLEGTCTVTMDKARYVKAAFKVAAKPLVNPQTLTLTKAGMGTGTVKAAGLICEAACTSTEVEYFGGQTSPPASKEKAPALVALVATPSAGSRLVGWEGCDSSTHTELEGTCTISMDKAQSVVALFEE